VSPRKWPLSVIGLDPSLTSFGAACLYGPNAVTLHRLKPVKGMTGHERLRWLLAAVEGLAFGCDVAVVEGAVLIAAGGGESRIATAGLHWMVRHRLWEIGVPYAVVTPATRAKYVTGNGAAGKDLCLAAAVKRFAPLFPGTDDDALPVLDGNDKADALTLAVMGAEYYGQPAVRMPADRTALLRANRTTKGHAGEPVIAWPQLKREAAPLSAASSGEGS
jgi:Holliday junction resolvasome RuvABC endonuclease subunit